MNFETQIDSRSIECIQNRLPTFGQLIESGFHQSRRPLRPRVHVRPSQRAKIARVLNGASSPANCARKIAGPFTVFIRANSQSSSEHLIMFCPELHTSASRPERESL